MPDVRAIPQNIAASERKFCLTVITELEGVNHAYRHCRNARVGTQPHHRQAVLDQFAKIIPRFLKKRGAHVYAPMVDHAAGVSFRTLAPGSIVMIEQWESVAQQAHLQTHMKPHIATR